MLRRLLVQLHWLLGISAGVVLAVVGVTGAVLSFEDEVVSRLNAEPVKGAPLLAPPELLARIQAAHPDKRVVSLTVYRDPHVAARAVFEPRELRYVNPYTGAVSPAPPRGAEFFRAVRAVHRWLAAGDAGKHVVGASTVALVVLCLSGLYLRWPGRVRDWRAWLTFNRRLTGRGFLWQLHAAFGTWVLLAYLLMGLTGLYWSYGWYRDLLFSATGAPRPVQRLQLPRQAVQVRYLDADAPHDHAFDRITIDRASGAVLQHERYAEKPWGAKLMSSIFALHSGSFFGLAGVIALAAASLLMPVFAVTGWMMYLGRRKAKTMHAALAPQEGA